MRETTKKAIKWRFVDNYEPATHMNKIINFPSVYIDTKTYTLSQIRERVYKNGKIKTNLKKEKVVLEYSSDIEQKTWLERFFSKKRKKIVREIDANPFWIIKGKVVTLAGEVKEYTLKLPNSMYWTFRRIIDWEKTYHKFSRMSPSVLRFLRYMKYQISSFVAATLLISTLAYYLIKRFSPQAFVVDMPSHVGKEVMPHVGYRFWFLTFPSFFHFLLWFIITALAMVVSWLLIKYYLSLYIEHTGASVTRIYRDYVLARRNGKELQPFVIPPYAFDNSVPHTLIWGRTGAGKTAPLLEPMVADRAARRGIVFGFDPKYDMSKLFPLFEHIYPVSLSTFEGYSIDLFDLISRAEITDVYSEYRSLVTKITAQFQTGESFWNEAAASKFFIPFLQYAREELGIPFGYLGVFYDLLRNPDYGFAYQVWRSEPQTAKAVLGKATDNRTLLSIIQVADAAATILKSPLLISLFSASTLTYDMMVQPSTYIPIGWLAAHQKETTLQLGFSLMFWIIDKVVNIRYYEAKARGVDIKKLTPIVAILDELQNMPYLSELATITTLYRGYGMQLVFTIQSYNGLIDHVKKYKREEVQNFIVNSPIKVIAPQGTEEKELPEILQQIAPEFLFINRSIGTQTSVSETRMEIALDKILASLSKEGSANIFTPLVIEPAPSHQAMSIVKAQYIPELKEQLEPLSIASFDIPMRPVITPQTVTQISHELFARLQ